MANLFDDLLPDKASAEPNLFDDLIPSTPLGTFGRSFARSFLPSTAALAAGGQTMLATAPLGPWVSVPAGLVAGGLAGMGTSKAQDFALERFLPDTQAQLAQDASAHPTAALLGQLAPQALTLRPGLGGVPLRLKAFGGGIGAAGEALAERSRGEALDPLRIGIAGTAGATLNRPTRFGQALGLPRLPSAPKPAEGPLVPLAPESQARVDKVVTALQTAKPVRASQEALMRAERSRRLGAVMAIRKTTGGEAGFHAELWALKGALPKAQFDTLRGMIGPEDIDGLMNDLNASPVLDAWEALQAKVGLSKLFAPTGGQVPTLGELSLLKRSLGSTLTTELVKHRPTLQKFGMELAEALNLPRAIMATADLSAPLRQGIFLIGRPKQWIPAFGSMVKQFFSEQAVQASQQQIRTRPTHAAMKTARLALTDIGDSFTQREELFMSRLLERVPIAGRVGRASNRAYVGFLNRLRADVFDDILAKGQRLGIADEPRFLDSLGSFVNAATGRGNMPQALERASVALNGLFFSPRLMASRLQLLPINPYSIAYYMNLHPVVRRQAIESLLTFAGAGMSVLGLAKLNGAQVGTDPRSADFGKIKVGNTRYDIWGGFQQYIRSAAQFITGKYISTTTGREITLGEGYKPLTRKDILLRQLESKAAPVLSFVLGWLEGTSMGDKFRPGAELVDRFIPMAIQDVTDLIREKGPILGIALGSPAFFGVGVQTYGNQIPQRTTTPSNREKIGFLQPPSLGERGLNYLTGTRVTNIPTRLHPALIEARNAEIRRQAELDKAKQIVLRTGQSMRVGDTERSE